MTDLISITTGDYSIESNVTTRKASGQAKIKMAMSDVTARDLERDGSLLLDSILSQDEEVDIIMMLNSANERDGGLKLPSFYTSSQMGGKNTNKEAAVITLLIAHQHTIW